MSKSVKIAFILTSALALSVAEPTLAQTSTATPHHNTATAAPADDRAASEPAADNNSEGLSRDAEDCNKGCIDKN